MRFISRFAVLGAAFALAGCSSLGGGDAFGSDYYSLVRVQRVRVGNGSLVVSPPRPWNKQRTTFFIDIR